MISMIESFRHHQIYNEMFNTVYYCKDRFPIKDKAGTFLLGSNAPSLDHIIMITSAIY